MIHPRDLRLGNLVFDKMDRVSAIEGIRHYPSYEDSCDIWLSTIEYIYDDSSSLNDCRLIPLTEEWLIKFGFEQANREYENTYFLNTGYIEFQWDKETGLDFSSEGQDIATQSNCIYVHQLQNLYFALTGEELTIKENHESNKEVC